MNLPEISDYLSKILEKVQRDKQNIQNQTPYGARKTAQYELQFSLDASYGLTRESYGWYSNEIRFDNSFFNELEGSIEVQTGSNTQDIARIRSAYPGQYFSHSLAEPGMGFSIGENNIERSNGRTSLTHGEISTEIVEWDQDTSSGISAHGLSFEEDATYVQVRKSDNNVEFIPQKDWNIDPLDGSGPSGVVMKPEDGIIANFPFTWYGFGSLYVAIQTKELDEAILVHKADVNGGVSISVPNMPVSLTIENKDVAEPLLVEMGGMQWGDYGSAELNPEDRGRTTEETRHTGDSYIDTNVVTDADDAVVPFQEPGVPLISARRSTANLESFVSLSVQVIDFFINSGGDVYVFIFDEFDETNALTGANFDEPSSRGQTKESRLQFDTAATAYTPGANAVLRGILYVKGDKNTAEVISGDSSSRLPIEATAVATAALPPGGNSTYAQPALLSMKESF